MKKNLLDVAAFAMAALLYAATGHATPITYVTSLSGPAESPPNASAGIGTAIVTIDTILHTLFVNVVFSGLMGTTTASHIHCCITTPGGTAGIATETPTFSNFPLGVTSGSYTNTYDLTLASSYNVPFLATNGGGTVAGAEAALAAGLAAGTAYLNIHTTFRPGGEIRGFLAVPEPGSLALIAAGLIALGWLRRRGRR